MAIVAVLATLLAGCASQFTPPSDRHKRKPAELSDTYYQGLLAQGKPVFRVDPARSIVVIEVRRGGSFAHLGHDHVVASHDVAGHIAPDPTTAPALKGLLDEKADFSKLEYQPLYRKRGAHLATVLKDPDAYHFEDLVVTLHDLMSAIKKLVPGLVEVPAAQCMGTYFRINERGEAEYSRRQIGGTKDFRYKTDNQQDAHFTLIESSDFVMAARVQGMPIWAGPSFTTARMMKMAERAGATPEEFEALAWGIFGFWNQCYPTTSTWVHRFHEVMDMAANWGVPFEPFAYPRSAPPGHRSLQPKL